MSKKSLFIIAAIRRYGFLFVMLISAIPGFSQYKVYVGETTTVEGWSLPGMSNVSWTSVNPTYLSVVSYNATSCVVRGEKSISTVLVRQSWTNSLGEQKSTDFSVTVESDTPEQINLSAYNIEMDVNQERTITATPVPSGAKKYTLSWSVSSQTSAVKIVSSTSDKEKCTFKGVNPGSAYVTATSNNGVDRSCFVRVWGVSPTEMGISSVSDIYEGEQEQFEVWFTPSDHHSTVTWSSSNSNVASIGYSSGLLTAKSSGTATITAKSANGLTATYNITVKDQPIKIVKSSPSVNEATDVPLDISPSMTFSPDDISLNYSASGFNYNNISLKADDGTVVARELQLSGSNIKVVPNRSLKPATHYTYTIPKGYLKINSTGETNRQEFVLGFTTTAEGEGGLEGSMTIMGLRNGKAESCPPIKVSVKNNSDTDCKGHVHLYLYDAYTGNLKYSHEGEDVVIAAGETYKKYFVEEIYSIGTWRVKAVFYTDDNETLTLGEETCVFSMDKTGSEDYVDESRFIYTYIDDATCYVWGYQSKYPMGTLTIPAEVNGHKVVGIGYQAFYGKFSDFKVKLPETIEWIATEAFSYSWLTGIDLSSSLSVIGFRAFYDTSIGELILPNGLDVILEKAFEECTSLSVIKLPQTELILNNYAFLNCTALKSVYAYYENPPYLDPSVFWVKDSGGDHFTTTATLYVPQGKIDIYKTKYFWNLFKNFEEFDAGTSGIHLKGNANRNGEDKVFDIYDLQGRKVRSHTNTTEGLPKGVYIIGKQKVIVP